MPPRTERPERESRLDEADRLALARFRSGDRRAAFDLLVRPHFGALASMARRLAGDSHGADDLVQEALVRAFQGLDRFRGEASLRTWLLRILARLATDPNRWCRGQGVDTLSIEIPDSLGEQPDVDLSTRELRDRLDEAMERLPRRQRAALHLRAAEGMDYRGIASTLECSEGAARMLVLEARKKVANRLGRHLEP